MAAAADHSGSNEDCVLLRLFNSFEWLLRVNANIRFLNFQLNLLFENQGTSMTAVKK